MTGSKHRYLTVSAIILMLGSSLASAQDQPVSESDEGAKTSHETGAYAPTAFVPGFKWTNLYLFPSAPKYYECCAEQRAPEIASALGGDGTRGEPSRSVVKPNPKSARIVKTAPAPNCVDLSILSPLDRLLRLAQAELARCVRFVTYDHFPCQCETSCNPSNIDWQCDCPNVPPGQLPEIKPQDSLGSQPEFLGTICTPCNSASVCP